VKPGWYVVAALVVAAGVVGVRRYRASHRPASPAAATAPPTYDKTAFNTHAPDSSHITVEVINATKVRGLGRRATFYLRDRGFDVMYVATTKEVRASTMVLDRSGHPDRAKLVGQALHAPSQSAPDSTRYIDVTVLLGNDWTPPPLPFYP